MLTKAANTSESMLTFSGGDGDIAGGFRVRSSALASGPGDGRFFASAALCRESRLLAGRMCMWALFAVAGILCSGTSSSLPSACLAKFRRAAANGPRVLLLDEFAVVAVEPAMCAVAKFDIWLRCEWCDSDCVGIKGTGLVAGRFCPLLRI